eukprot:1153916-Pelagomonas_calceolata.AAC.3
MGIRRVTSSSPCLILAMRGTFFASAKLPLYAGTFLLQLSCPCWQVQLCNKGYKGYKEKGLS